MEDVGSELPESRKEVMMARQDNQPATNERAVQPLEQVQAQRADSATRQEQIARDLGRLLKQQGSQRGADSWGGWVDESAIDRRAQLGWRDAERLGEPGERSQR